VVFPGQTLAEIPHAGAMEVSAYVLEADAGGLEPGRTARIYPESRPGHSYAATVTRVDSVAKPRFRASPVQYFTVTLSMDATDPEILKPGLGVRVEILLDDLKDALTVPRQAVFDRGDGKVVRRRERDGFEEVPVTVRTADRGRVVVEGDLEAGDRVALAERAAGAGSTDEGNAEDTAQADSDGAQDGADGEAPAGGGGGR
jgi:multidrug efflux pump subunit AcrA (membrane-fusion protein)